jgi:hypothetical protein
MQWFQYLIAPLIAGTVAAFASTYLTAHFSFNRFVQEQWWQARRDAYESIIRELSEIMFDNHSEFLRLKTNGVIAPPKASDREKQLTWNLQEIASGGAYIVSDKTVATIEYLLNVLSEPSTGDAEMFKRASDAARNALQVIKAEAHHHLGVK